MEKRSKVIVAVAILVVMVTAMVAYENPSLFVRCNADNIHTENTTKMTVDEYFQTTDFEPYIGCTVGGFLDDIPFKYNLRRGFDEPPGKLKGVRYYFDSDYRIGVFPKSLWHTKRFDRNAKWDLSDFSKEIIGGIEVRRFSPNPFRRNYGVVQWR